MLHRQARVLTCKNWKAWTAGSFCHVRILISPTARSVTTVRRVWRKTPEGLSIPIRDRDSRWINPRQCIVDTKDPARTAQSDVLIRLKSSFQQPRRLWHKFLLKPFRLSRYDEAIVILATPQFAQWLQNDSTFIPQVLKTIVVCEKYIGTRVTPALDEKRNPRLAFEVEVLCACVDALPPDIDWIKTRDARYPREGLAFLHGRADHIVPDLWKAEAEAGKGEALSVPASITFSSYRAPSYKGPVTEVAMPLASTLFVNGKESTMFASKWRLRRGNEQYEMVESKEKKHQVINVFGNAKKGFRHGRVPAMPLTPPRRIVSGLGNIIRELSFDNGVVGPASQELEDSVHEYMAAIKQDDSRVSVWALITPSESMPNPPLKSSFHSVTDPDAIKEFWQKGVFDTSYIGHWLDRGATLCNILGGGGGYGAMRGLLALDPQLTIDTTDHARFDDLDDSDQVHEAHELGGFAKPNSFIQFFLAPEGKKVRIDKSSRPDGKTPPARPYILTAIGAVPHEVEKLQASGPLVKSTPDLKNRTRIRFGHFGAVSESGLFLRSAAVDDKQQGGAKKHSQQTRVLSKVSSPYSYFYRARQLPQDKKADNPNPVQKVNGRSIPLVQKVPIHFGYSDEPIPVQEVDYRRISLEQKAPDQDKKPDEPNTGRNIKTRRPTRLIFE